MASQHLYGLSLLTYEGMLEMSQTKQKTLSKVQSNNLLY